MKKIPTVEEYLQMSEAERKEWSEDVDFLTSLDERLNKYLKYRPDLGDTPTRPVIVCSIDVCVDANEDTILCHENIRVWHLTDESLSKYHKIFTDNNRDINIRLVEGYVTINKDAPNKVHLSISKKHTINRMSCLNKKNQIVNNFDEIPSGMRWTTVYNSPKAYIDSAKCTYGKAGEIMVDDDGTILSTKHSLPEDTPLFYLGEACVEWGGNEASLRIALCEYLKADTVEAIDELTRFNSFLTVHGLSETEEWEGE